MDVRVHNIQSVTEEISYHEKPSLSFVTRKLRIIDDNGIEYSLTMFSNSIEKLTTSKREEYTYA